MKTRKNKAQDIKQTENRMESLSKTKMRYFLQKAFSIINPATKIKWNWHLGYLCDTLEEVANGKIKRLMINIPPRYLKSVICSVSFPAWLLGAGFSPMYVRFFTILFVLIISSDKTPELF